MVKVIYIAGVPAVGKSSLLFDLIAELFGYDDVTDAVVKKHGKCRYMESEDGKYKVLGIYDFGRFCGTDRLSMAVIDDAIDFIKALQYRQEKCVVFAEGDRLFNARFLSEARATVLVLDANETVLQYRHKLRGDSQSNTFLKRCRTKVENFIKRYNCMRIWNNTQDDHNRILNYLVKTAKEYVG